MPNTQKQFNPAYSTIKAIYLANQKGLEGKDGEKLNVIRQNTECVFERIEFVENVNDVLPSGILIVKDTKDILSRLKQFKIDKILIEFFDGKTWLTEITSASYINNAASDTEENFVGIYFTNSFYIRFQKSSLNQLLKVKKPTIEIINTFVDQVRKTCFVTSSGYTGYTEPTSNYVLYRPIATIKNRDEDVTEDPLQFLNYLATYANSSVTNTPNIMFWTEFDGSVNFKGFYSDDNITKDVSYPTIKSDYRYMGVFDGDAVIQKLSDDNFYRKIYFYNTDPGYQFISKNYFYIRKTPKFLDVIPTGISGATALDTYITSALSYHYQDEGQKYNIEIVDQGNSAYALPGANQLTYTNHWGWYDGTDGVDFSHHTHIGKDFGTKNSYASLNLMGITGFMQYVDNTEMWKNMFDLTPIHPNYSGETGSLALVGGTATKLQKILDIRYNSFVNTIGATADRLSKIREIELQNFIMYSLCCMGKKTQGENCFFAALTEYQLDNVTTQPTNVAGNFYRYKWQKLKFDSPYGACGPAGVSGPSGYTGNSGYSGYSGSTYYFHQVEKWNYDPTEMSNATQDDSWAINLNERGLTSSYLPPGWVSPAPTGFRLRPIGANTETIGACGSIFHIVKMCKISLEELLLESNNTVYPEFIGKYMYYFMAENVLDGLCVTTGSSGSSGSSGESGSQNL